MRKGRSIVRERSAGAVVYREGPSGREYLLLRYGAGHWGFPKGHVEGNETDEEAAVREVAEETSIPREAQRFVPGFREDTRYWFARGRTRVDKDVVFFLVEAEAASTDVRISHEHTGFAWLPFEEALKVVTFEGPQRVLRRAEEFLAGGPEARQR